MKKLYSLLKACLSSDMQLFKIKSKNKGKLLSIIIAGYLMFMIWGSANELFAKLATINMQFILLSVFSFGISIMTLVEGIYKSGPLLFNCKDDQLLFSLPIKKRTIFLIRVLKFYIFELIFNSLFLLPVMVAYIRWAPNIEWTYFLTSITMLIMLPIIPIVISCFIGVFISSISSRFKYKNIFQIGISMIILIGILLLSYKMDSLLEYLMKHSSSLNDLITKLYYPAGVYAKLITDFSIIDLLVFIIINIALFVVSIYILSKFYYKINSRMNKVITSKKHKIESLKIKSNSNVVALIKKELNTFFKTPVFIINSGFALVLFIIACFTISFKFDSIMPLLISSENGFGLSKNLVMHNISLLIFFLISATSYMTSITNSVISLEGKNINILKSLPLKANTILMSKIYSCLIITTPVLLVGDLILFIKFKIKIVEALLLIVLSLLIPLVSHFIGLIVNLKFPKLDAQNSTEVVKQSMSSFISVMIGMILLILSFVTIKHIIGHFNSTLVLLLAVLIYIGIDCVLYLYLINRGVKDFNQLSI